MRVKYFLHHYGGSSSLRLLKMCLESYRPLGLDASGERGCAHQQFENATPGNCNHLASGAAFLCSVKMCA